MLTLAKYSLGTGDRFGHQAKAQLRASVLARAEGLEIVPVWNKSNREHTLIGSEPASVREAAACAVSELGWNHPWHVDADHINMGTVDRFLEPSDFFTIDVADFIGKPPAASDVDDFIWRHPELSGRVEVPGIAESFATTSDTIRSIAFKFLFAVQEAGRIYRHIASRKGADNFITEVSMDETDVHQNPVDLLVILAAIADEKIPLQTIAPRFPGRFNKGVDYVGDVDCFAGEFSKDLAVLAFAARQYALPNLKLSLHSGSDKFSIYGPINRVLRETGAGLHVKTAGTSWLEELIGLAEAGGNGLVAVKEIYREAWKQRETLCAPYAAVIDIDSGKLPDPDAFSQWDSETVAATVRHQPSCLRFNSSVRQLLHVAFKLGAKMGPRYLLLLDEYEPLITRNVTNNLLERHIRPLFGYPGV